MNSTLRNLQRERKLDKGCDYTHGKLIKTALRLGFLNFDAVATCAFIRHRGSELALDEFAKRDCFLWFDRVLNRHEPVPMANELRRWGSRVTILAACGIVHTMSIQNRLTEAYHLQPTGLLQAIIDYASSDDPAEVRILRRVILSWHRADNPFTASNSRAETHLLTLQREIETAARREDERRKALEKAKEQKLVWTRRQVFPGLSIITRVNANMPDEIMYTSMQKFIVPWALKEFV